MMYICKECKRVFDEDETESVSSHDCCKNEYGGWDSWDESTEVCPYCGGEFEEAYYCPICEEYHNEDDMSISYEVCQECLDDFKENYVDDFTLLSDFSKDNELVEKLFNSVFDEDEKLLIIKKALDNDFNGKIKNLIKSFVEENLDKIVEVEIQSAKEWAIVREQIREEKFAKIRQEKLLAEQRGQL